MTFATACSGICAPELAWASLPWQSVFLSEIDADCNAVSSYHFPEVPNLGDMTHIGAQHGPVDLFCAGTPCQSFSVAGLRAGMDDPRGNLALEFLRIARDLRAEWVVWENVPGVLSSSSGRDLGAFLGGLEELGYGYARRILDAQYFGVPQRRERLFVVGHLGDWRGPAAVLFERQSLCWNPAPCREAREGIAATLTGGPAGGSSHGKKSGSDRDTLVAALSATGVGTCGADDNQAQGGHLLPAVLGGDGQLVGALPSQPGMKQQAYLAVGIDGSETGYALRAGASHSGDKGDGGVNTNMAIAEQRVRRLTPRECERLQGFPDDWTLVPKGNKLMADSPRYRMIGNSMAVPVMRWIGERIEMVRRIQPCFPLE